MKYRMVIPEKYLFESNSIKEFMSKIIPQEKVESIFGSESFKRITKLFRSKFISKFKSELTFGNAADFTKTLKLDPKFIDDFLDDIEVAMEFLDFPSEETMDKKDQAKFFGTLAALIMVEGGPSKVAPGEYKRKEGPKPEEKTKKETDLPDYIQSKLDKLSDEQKRQLLGMLQ